MELRDNKRNIPFLFLQREISKIITGNINNNRLQIDHHNFINKQLLLLKSIVNSNLVIIISKILS